MKILYLKLKNFATVYTGMKKKTLEIDFSKASELITLFIGENGSGKTSVLSTLHPFAYPGNSDVRNGGDLIMEGLDGYKEIHIQDENDIYIIKHHYNFNRGTRNVKSYFFINGEDKNPNGNVTSFKELVYMYFGIDDDYLRLIRLGSNVSNFIDMKFTERKNYTSNLLSDIDVYSQFYKKINEDNRLLRGLIKNVSDKLIKLNVIDKDVLINTIHDNNKLLEDYKKSVDSINTKLGNIDGQLVTIMNGLDFIDLKNKIKSLSKENSIIEDDIAKLILKNESNKTIDLTGYTNESIANQINTLKNSIEMLKNTNVILLNQQDDLLNRKLKKENNLKYMATEEQYSHITTYYLDLNNSLNKIKDRYINYKPMYSKDEIKGLIGLMQTVNSLLQSLYEYPTNSIELVLRTGISNIPSLVKNQVTNIDIKASKLLRERSKIQETTSDDIFWIMYVPPECTISHKCPYKDFYDNHGTKDEKKLKLDEIDTELVILEKRREVLVKALDSVTLFKLINQAITGYSDLLNKLNIPEFKMDYINSLISKFEGFDIEDKLVDIITEIEEYEEFISLEQKIKDTKKELINIESQMHNHKEAKDELFEIDNSLNKVISDISNNTNSIMIYELQITDLNDKKMILESINEYEAKLESMKLSIEENTNSLKTYETIFNKVISLTDEKESIKYDLSMKEKEISILNRTLLNDKMTMRDFETFSDEKELLETKFDDISILKEALSSNKGIPLLFIQLYLKNTKIIANQLLGMVYKGELEIADFIINDKEFRIPYIKNGILIDDVIKASQGEKSFISLAISFALIMQSVKKYNILLLDEIDATLDQKNRYLFINILEKFLTSINAEQAFLISHNNMFDSYSVNVIKTSDTKVENNKNMNVIYP